MQYYAEQIQIDGRFYSGDFAYVYAVCGEDVCRTLMQAFGGREIIIPVLTDERLSKTKLAKLIGENATRALQREFGGGRITIPIGGHSSYYAQRFARCEQVRALTVQGDSAGKIAAALGVTTRTVSNIRRRLRERGELPKISTTVVAESPHT